VRSINVEHGQVEGDYAIVRCARAIQSVLRPEDFVARYGGDEFGVILPETSSTRARYMQEEARLALQGAKIEAAVGLGFRNADSPFEKASLIADSMMYEDKARSKRSRAA
jgi:diguanylate cyclase (GGDEF)-like protein